MIENQSLKTFLTVAELLSFSRAAEKLHITQPAVSQRIQQLEEQLQTSLFNRVGKKLLLTDSGKILQEKGRHLLREVEDLTHSIQSHGDEVQGTLRFGTSHHLGLHRLPSILRQYNESYPKVTLDLQFMESESAYQRVQNGDLELAIVTLNNQHSNNLITTPLWDDPLRFVCAPNHPLTKYKKLPLKTLAEHPCILPEEDTFTGKLIHTVFSEKKLRLNVALATNYLETIKMLTSVGLGWSVLPESLLDESLVVLPCKEKPNRTLGIIQHRQRSPSNSANALISLLQATGNLT